MRAKDIQPGEQYILRRAAGRAFRVTVLSTPPEIREQGRFLVRFEEGVMQGRVTEQLPRFILAPVDTGPASSRTGTEPAPPAVAIPAAWPPNLGDPVTWPAQTGPLRWRVVAVDAERGQARISGRVLEMKQEHDVLLADLEAVPIVVKSRSSSTRPSPQRPPNPESQRDRSPPDERSRVERAVDRLEFSAECLRQYQRVFAPNVPWREISSRLRRELRNQGELARRKSEYLRIRTRRFEVVVTERPSDEHPFLVERLVPRGRPRRHGNTNHRQSRGRPGGR
jgi:hypothetical protein